MILIIGGSGFVGQAYPRLFERLGLEYKVVTRDNYLNIDPECDILINANGNSKKFLSDRDPVFDFDASVTSVVRSLERFKPKRYVLLSSGDVYPSQRTPEETRESDALDTTKMSRYGFHKYLAETIVAGLHPEPLIIRMGGFVGPGLQKNAIFDMMNDEPVWLHPDSELQFISTDHAAELVFSLVQAGVSHEIVNLGATGVVRIGDVYDRLNAKGGFKDEARLIRFELSTEKLARLSSIALASSAQQVDAFLSGATTR